MPIRTIRNIPASLALILALVSCGGGGGGGSSSPTEPRSSQTVTIQVRENSYEPRAVTIQPGDTVRWEMRGSDPTHTVTEIGGAFDSGTVFTALGSAFERRFDTGGRTYNYSCRAHGDCCQMKGSVRVGQDAPDSNPGYE